MSGVLNGIGSVLEAEIRRIVREELDARAKARAAQDTPNYTTIAAYAAARAISLSTVKAAIRSGRLPAKKFGRAVRVDATVEIGDTVRPNAGDEGVASFASRVLARVKGGE